MSEIKLLIIDDEEEIREVLNEVFEKKGYTVATAGTGAEAFEKANEAIFDVALIDMNLPDTDGVTILKELLKGNPEMSCIIITGFATLDNSIAAFKDGADGYFVKPLKINEVVHGVQEATNKQFLQRALKKSEERYRGIVESTMDAIIGLGPDANIISWNKGAEEMFGYSAEEIRGKSQFSLVPEELRDTYAKNLEEAKSEGHVKEVETMRMRKDGAAVLMEMTLTALNDDNGKHIGFVSILRDITKRKDAETRIKKYASDLEERLMELEAKGVSRFAGLIKEKNSYLIKEKRSEKGIAVFSNLITFGLTGLFMTTKHPDVLKDLYNIKEFKGEFQWLSSQGGEENAIDPSNLTAIHARINDFFKNNANTVVLFLGLEYIINLTGFEKTLKFLNAVIDAVAIYNSRLIISLDPETLETRELSLLENALIETKDDDLIRLGLE